MPRTVKIKLGFCATGQGGGVDNSCGKGEGGGGGGGKEPSPMRATTAAQKASEKANHKGGSHVDAAKAHTAAAKAHEKAGNTKAAEKHREFAKGHMDKAGASAKASAKASGADKVEKSAKGVLGTAQKAEKDGNYARAGIKYHVVGQKMLATGDKAGAKKMFAKAEEMRKRA